MQVLQGCVNKRRSGRRTHSKAIQRLQPRDRFPGERRTQIRNTTPQQKRTEWSSLLSLASWRRCDFKTRKRYNFYSAPETLLWFFLRCCGDFSAICAAKLGKLQLCNLKSWEFEWQQLNDSRRMVQKSAKTASQKRSETDSPKSAKRSEKSAKTVENKLSSGRSGLCRRPFRDCSS